MSWHSSLAGAGAYLPGTCSASDASALSKSTSTPGASCSPGRTTEASNRSPSGTTSGPSTRCRGAGWSRSCRADFPAPTSASLVAAQASTARLPDSGRTWPGSFATFDRGSCSWKTAQPSLLGDSAEFSATWPRSGTMRNGACWERATLAPTTDANGSGSLPTPLANDRSQYHSADNGVSLGRLVKMLPTPTAADATGGPGVTSTAQGGMNLRTAVAMLPTPTVDGNYNRKGASATSGDGLHTAVTKLATPTSRDWRSGKASPETMERNARPPSEQIGGPLNPEFVERMMGWPLNWTRTDGAIGADGASLRPSASCPTAPQGSSASATARSRSARPKRSGSLPAAEGGERDPV